MNLRYSSLAGFAILSCVATASPDCLIVQLREPQLGDSDPNFSLAPFVAEELDKAGRVRPVVWSMLDPVFRQWTSNDVFKGFEPNPNLSTALDISRKLGVRYLLAIRGYRIEQKAIAIGELYVNGRSVWRFGPRKPAKGQDFVIQSDGKYDGKATRAFQAKMPGLAKSEGTFTVFQNGVPDFIETARAVASTWTVLLGEAPFKSLPVKPRLLDSDIRTGSNIDSADLKGPEGSDSQSVLAEAREFSVKGNFHRSLILLREVADRKPFDLEIRIALIETMILAGMPEEAAQAAQAATQIKPDDPSIWLIAARSWIGSSNQENAAEALSTAITKGAKGPEVTELEGELALLGGDAKGAVAKFSTLKGTRSTLRRAVALALTGDSEGCTNALKELGQTPLSEDDYRTAILFIERSLLKLGDLSRSVIPRIRLHPGAPETLAQATLYSDLATALSTLVGTINPPEIHTSSHEARKLAHILLAQASLEALEFAKNNDPELAEEATATLGQAFKLFPGVREKFSLERKYGRA